MRKQHFNTEQATEAMRKTAGMLAREGINVTTQGARAFIEWKPTGEIVRINLPMVPRDASPEFLAALQGFLDHEVGHALNTTPVESRAAEKKAAQEMGVNAGVMRGMTNVVEDVRIEACMEAEFPGSRRNLSAVRKFFVDVMQTNSLGKIPDGPEYDAQRRAYIVPIFMRARGGQSECEAYMTDKNLWGYMEGYDRAIPDLAERLKALSSTLESVALAAHIIKMTSETTPPQDDEAEQEEEQEEEQSQKEARTEISHYMQE